MNDKPKRKNQIIYKPPLWERLLRLPIYVATVVVAVLLLFAIIIFAIQLLTVGRDAGSFLGVSCMFGGILWFLLGMAAYMRDYIDHYYIALSDEGIEWKLRGTRGFTEWHNIESFGEVALSNKEALNWGFKLRKAVDATIDAKMLNLGSPRTMFHLSSDANELLRTFIPLRDIVNVRKLRNSPTHPFRLDVEKYAPHLFEQE